MGKRISINEWAEMAKKGQNVTISTILNSESMRPLIRRVVDPVTIVPLTREPLPGDVVLITDGKRYAVRRVLRIFSDLGLIQTWADGCKKPDRPVPKENAVGLVIKYNRNGKDHILDCDEAREKGIKWMESTFLRNAYLKKRQVTDFGKNILSKGLDLIKSNRATIKTRFGKANVITRKLTPVVVSAKKLVKEIQNINKKQDQQDQPEFEEE